MSVEAITLVLHHSRAQGTNKVVLLGIANHYGDEGAWPAVATLAKYANVSERTVQRSIKDLVDLGEVQVDVQDGGSRPTAYKPNRYWLHLACPDGCDRTTQHRVRGDAHVTPRGDADVTPGVTQMSPESLRESKRESKTYVQGDLGPAFEKFWEIYPRREKKPKALKAFIKWAGIVGPDVILAGAERYRDDPNRLKPFTRIPESWLNGNCWDDDPLPERELSKDEQAARQANERQRAAEREREHNRRVLESIQAAQAAAEKNPVKTCTHGRIVYACRICAPTN